MNEKDRNPEADVIRELLVFELFEAATLPFLGTGKILPHSVRYETERLGRKGLLLMGMLEALL